MNAKQLLDRKMRLESAMVIDRKVVEMAAMQGLRVTELIWNLNQGMDHAGPHRLDIYADDKSVRMYFTDAQLLAHTDVDDRLSDVISYFEEEIGFSSSSGLHDRFLTAS